jgi:hypothetical protein
MRRDLASARCAPNQSISDIGVDEKAQVAETSATTALNFAAGPNRLRILVPVIAFIRKIWRRRDSQTAAEAAVFAFIRLISSCRRRLP